MGTRKFLARLLVLLIVVTMIASAALIFTARQASAASKEAVTAIESQLICPCGCTKVNAVCDCTTAADMRAEISKMLDGGKNTKQILDFYVVKYGKTTLAAPTKEGFDIAAWVTPFLAIALAGSGLWFVLRRWAASGARKRLAESGERSGDADLTERQKSRVEREFRDYF